MKTIKVTLKTIDLTEGKKPNIKNGEEYTLTVTYHNGQRYCYYGTTKKEAETKFKKEWGTYRGFKEKEWKIDK